MASGRIQRQDGGCDSARERNRHGKQEASSASHPTLRLRDQRID
jgi:hypothetical protein